MEALAILGLVWGILGFVFGMIGYVIAMVVWRRNKALASRMERLELESGATPGGLRPAHAAGPALTTGPTHPVTWPALTVKGEPVTFGDRLVPADVAHELAVLVRHDQPISAIKTARERLGLGLTEAKQLVDDVARRQG